MMEVNLDIRSDLLLAAVLSGLCATGEYGEGEEKQLVLRAWKVVHALYSVEQELREGMEAG